MTDSSRLVDHQLRLVEIKRGLEQARGQARPVKSDEVRYGPCVLLSRECGSAGDELAQLVGERLHWQVFNREIVEQIAEQAHVRRQLVESVDEQVRSRWQRLMHPIRERHGLKPATYLFHLCEIVLSLGHHGYVVIVGHGAPFLLPAESGIRVRVVEPLAARVRRMAGARSLSADAAARFVQECEANRAEFIRKSFHQDSAASLNYDLVLNTDILGVEAAATLVVTALERKLGVPQEALCHARRD
jgi:hypothetical protein